MKQVQFTDILGQINVELIVAGVAFFTAQGMQQGSNAIKNAAALLSLLENAEEIQLEEETQADKEVKPKKSK